MTPHQFPNPVITRFLFLFSAFALFTFCAFQNKSYSEVSQNSHLINVKDLGARGDGEAYDSGPIQEAIDAISELGGGTVYIPPGDYLIKPLTLRSNLTLHLEKGATLYASDNFDHYPYVETRWEGTVCKGFQPILYAHSEENITITGGAIDGQGQAWWDEFWRIHKIWRTDPDNYEPANRWSREMAELNKNCPPLEHRPQWTMQWLRPVTIQFFRCKNVRVEQMTIKNTPFWSIHPVFTENAHFNYINIENPWKAPNTDGIDIESCNNVIVSNCIFTNGDDCIAIKSGIDIDGRNYNVPSKNIVISNNIFSSRHTAIAIGSEMSGGVENVLVSDCIIPRARHGLIIKSKRSRGGYVKNIRYSNIVMGEIDQWAMSINTFYRGGNQDDHLSHGVDEGTPFIHHIFYSGIQVDSCGLAIDIRGLPESPIRHVYLNNVFVSDAEKETRLEHSDQPHLNEVYINEKKLQSWE